MMHSGFVFPLGLFCGCISIVMFCFGAYHISLVCRGITTNESYKWSEYRGHVRWHHRREQRRLQATPQNKKEHESDEEDEYDPNERPPRYTVDAQGLPVPARNIYNEGAWKNLGKVFFPRDAAQKRSVK